MTRGAAIALIATWIFWATAWAASFVIPMNTPPQGDGFTRGSNRIEIFLALQALAAILAIDIYALRPKAGNDSDRPDRWLRRLGLIPILLAGGLIAMLLLFIGSALLG
jgi:hypothetical protein